MGCVCSSVAPSSSVLPLFSVYGALHSSCLRRGRGWGKLRGSEAKRSGLALEQGSGLLFHNLISSQPGTAASQKAAINLQPGGQEMQCSRLRGGYLSPTQPLAKQENLPKTPRSSKSRASRALFVPCSHTLPALPSHPGCSCLFSSQHPCQFSSQHPCLAPCPCCVAAGRELQPWLWSCQPEEAAGAPGEREAAPGT